jgi:hypothetical protein
MCSQLQRRPFSWLHWPVPNHWSMCYCCCAAAVQGYGVYVFGSGQRYEGHWEKGKKHGWSIYTVETGECTQAPLHATRHI